MKPSGSLEKCFLLVTSGGDIQWVCKYGSHVLLHEQKQQFAKRSLSVSAERSEGRERPTMAAILSTLLFKTTVSAAPRPVTGSRDQHKTPAEAENRSKLQVRLCICRRSVSNLGQVHSDALNHRAWSQRTGGDTPADGSL